MRLQTPIRTRLSTVRDIAGDIYKFAFLFAGRTLFRGLLNLKRITAVGTFPLGHDVYLLSFLLLPSPFGGGGLMLSNDREGCNMP